MVGKRVARTVAMRVDRKVELMVVKSVDARAV